MRPSNVRRSELGRSELGSSEARRPQAWWLARGVAALPDGRHWLTAAEAARAQAFRLVKRRTEYLLRRLVAKHTVAALAGLSTDLAGLARIEIANDLDGAPRVTLDGISAPWRISLTDRAGWAVCLIAAGHAYGGEGPGQLRDPREGTDSGDRDPGPDQPVRRAPWREQPGVVGCDLELVEPRSEAFVRHFFTAAEREAVAACPDCAARNLVANLVWSAKESALKVLRTGLRLDTRQVEVRLPANPAVREASFTPVPRCPDVAADGVRRGDQEHPEQGWSSLSVRVPGGVTLPGWWRRDGAFLLTAVGLGDGAAPRALEPPNPLGTACPFPDTFRRI